MPTLRAAGSSSRIHAICVGNGMSTETATCRRTAVRHRGPSPCSGRPAPWVQDCATSALAWVPKRHDRRVLARARERRGERCRVLAGQPQRAHRGAPCFWMPASTWPKGAPSPDVTMTRRWRRQLSSTTPRLREQDRDPSLRCGVCAVVGRRETAPRSCACHRPPRPYPRVRIVVCAARLRASGTMGRKGSTSG